jgi:hypothetical protein
MNPGRALVVAVVATSMAACSSSGGSSSPLVAASQQSVSFVVDGTRTYGTLDVPAHQRGQHLAAALLIAGSGPTDRDGDQPGAGITPHTLQLIAGVLDRMGVMSLRFDKYFSGRTGAGSFAADPARITLPAYIQQAAAGYHLLAAEPETDPDKMLLLGHSEGGMYALLIAQSVSPRPAGLALIEPQDERALDLLRLQIDEQLNDAASGGKLSAAAEEQNAAAVQQAIRDFRAGRPVDTAAMLPGIAALLTSVLTGTNAAYTRSADAIYPPTVAAKLARGTRVLVTDGTKDTNVPPTTIGPLMHALAAAGTNGPALRMLTGVNHLLHVTGTPDNDRVLAPSAIHAITAWARPYADKP